MSTSSFRFIVKLQGGIGNQLFQYAFGQYMATSNYGTVSFSTDSYLSDTYGRKSVLELLFKDVDFISLADSDPTGVVLLTESALQGPLSPQALNKFMHDHHLRECVLDGYWQDIKYVSKECVNKLRVVLREFYEIAKNSAADTAFIDISNAPNSVAVHVRRHDYKHHGICHESYYTEVLSWLQEHYIGVKIFVFTDEPNYTKHFLNNANINCNIVNTGDDLIDLHLMTKCKLHVIANSSYSWWGTLLSDSSLTVYPLPWSRIGTTSQSLFHQSWHPINNAVIDIVDHVNIRQQIWNISITKKSQ
jgi:hypothetical protein